MATAKQLAALKKARAARKKKTITKVRSKIKAVKSTSCSYVVKVVTTANKTGYYKKNSKGLQFDTELSNAECGAKRVMDNYAALIFSAKPHGIKSVEVIKK